MTDEELHDFAAKVAVYLDGFSVADDGGWGVHLTHNDGRRLWVQEARQPGRVCIEGQFPRSDHYFHAGERDGSSLSVALTRDPHAVARDILRRLMPTYRRVLDQVRRKLAQTAQDDARRAAVAQRLAGLIPGAKIRTTAVPDGETQVHWHLKDNDDHHSRGYGEIRLHGAATSARVEIRSIGTTRLQQLLAGLNDPAA